MSESENIDNSLMGLPVIETVDKIIVAPGILPSNAIHGTELLAQLPLVGNSIARTVVKSTSFNDSSISFNHSVNMNDIISRGVCFTIENLTMSYETEGGLVRADGENITPLTGQAKTDFESSARSINLISAKIGLKNFASCIESVTCNFGNGFNFTVTDAGILNEVLPFFSPQEDHKFNPPLRFQKGFQHSQEIGTDIIMSANGAEIFNSGVTSSTGMYNPFCLDSAFSQRTSGSNHLNLRNMLSTGTVDSTGKVLIGENTGIGELVFRNVRFSLPSDIFRENVRLDEIGLYGMETLDITITLSRDRIKTLLITPADHASEYNIGRSVTQTREKYTLNSIDYVPVYKFKEFKSFFNGTGGRNTSAQVNMFLTKRTPISAVEAEMRKSGNFYLPYKDYRVTKHGMTNIMSRGSGVSIVDSRDVSTQVVPSHIMFFFQKIDKRTGNIGYGRIDNARVSVNSRETTFSTNTELYNASVANGYSGTQADYSSVTGSIACLDLTSLNVGTELLVGEAANINISVSATCSRIDGGYNWDDKDTDRYELVVILVCDKVVARKDGKFAMLEGYKISAEGKSVLTYDSLALIARKPLVYGGSFFGSVWRGIKKGVSALPAIASTVARYAPAVQKYGQLASDIIGSGARKNSYISGGASLQSDAHMFR